MSSCITYYVGIEFELESIVPSTKAGKWRMTGVSGWNVQCTICSASSPS